MDPSDKVRLRRDFKVSVFESPFLAKEMDDCVPVPVFAKKILQRYVHVIGEIVHDLR